MKILEGLTEIARKEQTPMTSVALDLLEQGLRNYNNQDLAITVLDSPVKLTDRFSKLKDALYDVLATGRSDAEERSDTVLKQFQLLSLAPSLKGKSINVFQIQSGAVYQMTVKVIECLKLLDGMGDK